MSDTFSKEERSRIMRNVKSRGNKSTELKLLAYFKSLGITGWRRSYHLYGKPDFTFPNKKIVIFVDGCFWHGHNCRNTKPKANAEYWSSKITRNQMRDIDVSEKLTKKGWRVIRIWECTLKKKESLDALLSIHFLI